MVLLLSRQNPLTSKLKDLPKNSYDIINRNLGSSNDRGVKDGDR